MNQNSQPAELVKIWDVWVRLFHWSLAGCVLFLLVSGTTGWQFFEWHRLVGEAVLALILFRLCWGLAGSSNARLGSLLSTPWQALQHLLALIRGSVPAERGHNAAGGWAVLIMLMLISFQAVSGLLIADEEELIEGAFYGTLSGELSDELLHLHHLNGTVLKVVVLVHVIMIGIYAWRASQNLLKPMLTGSMWWPTNTRPPAVAFQHGLIGLLIAVVCVGVTGLILSWW
jgi:cytochrome b